MLDERLPGSVHAAVDAWLDVHDRLAPDVVEGLYLVGSAALADWQLTSDVDIVAFVADPTDADIVARLEVVHHAFRAEPDRPTVDGPFLSWADVSSPPLAAQRPWSLDGEFHFDGECFEINPVTWFTLATRGVAARGPAAPELDVALDAADRRRWVRENVDTYWRGVHGQVSAVLEADPDRDEFDAAILEWCVLGIARMEYSFDTAEVTSKRGAGEWAIERHPEHEAVLRAALAVRVSDDSGPVGRPSVVESTALLGDLVDRIAGT